MYEILAGMDAYITDYSSACFEVSFAGIPVFLYADDVEAYTYNRVNLFWNMAGGDRHSAGINRELLPQLSVLRPFPLVKDNDELESDIRGFGGTEYACRLDEFRGRIGLVFDSHASGRLAEVVEV